MEFKNERTILNIIRYVPPFAIIVLSIIICFAIFLDRQLVFEEKTKLLRDKYIETNKSAVKIKVDNLASYIENIEKTKISKLKSNVKDRVLDAHEIAKTIYEANKNKDKEEIKKMIYDALSSIRFNEGRGYYFIYTLKGVNVLHQNKKLEGKDFWAYQDAKGTFLLQNMNNFLKNQNEKFYNWFWYKPNNQKKEFEKVGFFKKFEPFEWFIGTGEYIDDFENDLKQDVLNYVKLISYDRNEYIFVLNYDGVYLSHINKKFIGRNALEVKDTKIHETITNSIKMAKSGSGYITYIQTKKPGTTFEVKKTSYIKGIQHWNWLIGQGFYDDDLKTIVNAEKESLSKQIEKDFNNVFIITVVLTLLLLFVSIMISRVLEKRFRVYTQEIKKHLENNSKQQHILSQQAKHAAMGEMIGNIAHQWRQPLSLITTVSSSVNFKLELGPLDNVELVENMNTITKTAEYLSRTIDDFRNFFSTNKEKVIFDVEELVGKTLRLLNAQFKNKDIEVIINVEKKDINNLENELVQVLLNILNNARDELVKKDIQRFVFIDGYCEKDKYIIKIKDTAGGAKEDIIEHLCEPYFTTKHKSKGTGVGLYMVDEIITRHIKGSLELSNKNFVYENKNYKGLEITISIPFLG